MATPNDQGLVASSEFDPIPFQRGVDSMIASLTNLVKKEEELRQKLGQLNQEMGTNRSALKATQDQINALDRTSRTYASDLEALHRVQARLNQQQQTTQSSIKATQTELTNVAKSADNFKTALTNLGTTATKVMNEQKGRGLFDTAAINKQVTEVLAAGSKLRDVFQGKIDDSELEELERRLGETSDEFQQLAQVVDFVRAKLETLDPNSEEFQQLNQVVEVGEQVLAAYGQTQENVGKKSQSLRGRLTELRTQMVALEEQGKENTAEFQKLQIEAGQLADSIADAQQRIRVLASDTRLLDFGLGAARAAAAGYGVFAGVMELAGLKSEDTLQTIARLNAVMAILNGLQEIQNLLQKQSVVVIVGQELALKAGAIAQRVYAVAVGTSTGAMRAFRVALLATGIGAFIVLLGLAADALGVFSTEMEDATRSAEGLGEAIDQGVLRMEGRLQAIKNQTVVEEEEAKRRITNENQQAEALSRIRIQSLQRQQQELIGQRNVIRQTQDAYLARGGADQKFIEESNQRATQLAQQARELGDQIFAEEQKNLTRSLEERRKAYDAFLTRLLQLQRRLRDAQLALQPQDAEAITQALTNTLNDALEDLDREVRAGKLTQGRANVLGELLRQITTAETDAQLREFHQRALEAQRQFDEELIDLQDRSTRERVELLRDELVREAEVIQLAQEQEAAALIRERDALLRNIQATQREGLISPEQAEENAAQVINIFEQLLTNLAQSTTQKMEAIARGAFQRLTQDVQRQFELLDVALSESATQEIVVLARRFAAGRITFERYQKDLTAIVLRESTARINQQLKEAETLLALQQQRIREVERANALRVQGGEDADQSELNDLRKEEAELRNRIAALRRQLAEANVQGTQTERTELSARIQVVAQYAQAIGNIVNQVVGFWQKANEAEQQALERSIALQQRRVEAAVRVAERGNAEYLRLEEERLAELQAKQEQAARRQLAINAVLQTSQALTAFVSALAQGMAIGGPLGGIAIAAAVLGLLASGYAIVQSLTQDNIPKLKGGSKYVRRGKNPPGEDTIPVMLNEGEAVVPTEENQDYKPAVAAIIDREIPPEYLNRFVLNYKMAQVPQVDYDRMGAAAEMVIGADARLLVATQEQNRLLSQQNEELRLVRRAFSDIKSVITLDKNGFGLATYGVIQQIEIDKKT